MKPYRFTCLTCDSVLRVDDAQLVGKVLSCPRCESMVQVPPPQSLEASNRVASEPAPLPAATGGYTTYSTVAITGLLGMIGLVGAGWLLFGNVPEPPAVSEAPVSNARPVPDPVATDTNVEATRGEVAPERDAKKPLIDEDHEDSAGRSEDPADRSVTTDRPQIAVGEFASASDMRDAEEAAAPHRPPVTQVGEKHDSPTPTSAETSNGIVAQVGVAQAGHQEIDGARVDGARVDGGEVDGAEVDGGQDVEPATTAMPLPEPHLDVVARLQIELAAARFERVKFRQFASAMSQLSTVPIEYDAATLHRVGHDADDTIRLQTIGATTAEVLDKAFGQWGLTYRATGSRVLVVVPPAQDATLRRVRYRVADLAAGSRAVDQLSQDIRTLCGPTTWDAQGGRGTIESHGGELVVRQALDVHYEIYRLLGSLRVARRGRPAEPRASKRFDLTTRAELAATLGAKEVSMRPLPGDTLARVARRLSAGTGIAIAIDELALLEAGTTSKEEVEFQVDTQPLGATLTELLEPLGLEYWFVNREIIQVTTPVALAKTACVEFYDLGEFQLDDEGVTRLIERIEAQVAPESWSDSPVAATMRYDAPSRYLVVRQTPIVQRELATTMAGWLNLGRE
ncbi:MAG: hypothetical protein DWQ42_11660 [Planctomycetota bacterium]|nr:MAG: hypothetical protein DWQ42_11660 [Planctomycetota bacterium]REK43506.1 MAG: hypothetical protein DWQ46_11405 [Planctomycetota bacterium]